MISASVVADSISPDGVRLTTMLLRYPRFIHAEFMTHRMFSRNASSSRAIPVERMLEDVMTDPAKPVRWGVNGKGMQDHGEMTVFGQRTAESDWLRARDAAVEVARTMLDRPERAHKQIINRILEPFMHISVLVTATEWSNFFWLRDHKDADPTIALLAATALKAYQDSRPREVDVGGWHLPFIGDDDLKTFTLWFLQDGPKDEEELIVLVTALACRVSAARCARVSYLNHDGTVPDPTKDLELFKRLVEGERMHASPLEHQATPDLRMPDGEWDNTPLQGNLVGWMQFRKFFPNESQVQHVR
jgi:hypothetical protein